MRPLTMLPALLLACCLACVAIASEETIHFREGGGTGFTDVTFDDAWLKYSPADDNNHGDDSYSGIQCTSNGVATVLAVKGLFTELPKTDAGSEIEITEALLHLYRYQGAAASVIGVYRATTDWLGDSAGTNETDVSGLHAEISSSTEWADGAFSDGDYDDSVCCTANWNENYNGECVVDVTALVQAIYDGETNYGFALTINSGTSLYARASEYATLAYRPSLEITYEYVAADVTEGLVSRYTFDSDASDCVGDNDGTLTDGASIVSDGERGYVLSLDGTNDFVDLPTTGLTGGRSEMTLSMWLKPDETAGTNTIWDEHNNWYWQFTVRQDTWATRDSSTGTTGARNNDLAYTGLGSGNWKHLAVVYSVTAGTKEIYIDGESVTSTSTSVDTLTSDRSGAYIGRPSDGTYFDGKIDDVRLYNRALSEEEIGILAGGSQPTTYTLTVNSGSGDGVYEEYYEANISADSPPAHMEFDEWIGDTACVTSVTSSSTTVTMPADDVTVTATYTDILYTLTVNSGTGDGSYAYGTNVNIAADSPPAHMEFDCWIGATSGIADVDDPTTSITMPASNATVTATYTDVLYTLTVNSGSGDGSYAAETMVNIAADSPPAHMEFDCWIGATSGIADVDDPTTSIAMPASNATVTATYTDILYTLTVNSGSGDGSYAYGTNVNISADAAPSGHEFSEWTGDTANVTDVEDPTTSVTMPADEVTITATYVSAGPTTTLIVNWGDSAGNNVYDFSNWDSVYLGQYTSYTSDGPDGIKGSWTGTAMSGRVGGSTASFASGDVVTATWYNGAGSGSYTFTPKVSFDDPDSYGGGTSGTWYDMTQGVCPAGQSITTTYTFSAGSAGNYGLVNVTRYNADGEEMVMDKVELTTQGGATTYTLTVNSGLGDGSYEESQEINISADSAPSGYAFDDWVGDTAHVDDVDDPTTSVTMPADDVEVTATYEAAATYTLTVNSGSGDGSYAASTVVNISANAAASGYTFDCWVGNTSGIANVNASSTTLTMPAANQTITATYEEAGDGPSISSTSGTWSHGNSVTISGSGFGTKATAAPIRFDTFEDGVVGTNVTTTGYWSAQSPSRTLFDDDTNVPLRHGNSDRHVRWHAYGYPDATGHFYREDIGFADTGKAYVNVWLYMDFITGDPELAMGWQVKLFRIHRNSDHSSEPMFINNLMTLDEETVSYWVVTISGTNGGSIWPGGSWMQEGYWVNMAMEYKDSTLDVANGEGHFYSSRAPLSAGTYYKGSKTGVATRHDAVTGWVDCLSLGYYITNGADEANTYWDDVYIDKSWARVEVGDASTYANCKHREMQIPTSWSGNSVTVTAQRGSLDSLSGKYLFVIDEDGNVSQGYGL